MEVSFPSALDSFLEEHLLFGLRRLLYDGYMAVSFWFVSGGNFSLYPEP